LPTWRRSRNKSQFLATSLGYVCGLQHSKKCLETKVDNEHLDNVITQRIIQTVSKVLILIFLLFSFPCILCTGRGFYGVHAVFGLAGDRWKGGLYLLHSTSFSFLSYCQFSMLVLFSYLRRLFSQRVYFLAAIILLCQMDFKGLYFSKK